MLSLTIGPIPLFFVERRSNYWNRNSCQNVDELAGADYPIFSIVRKGEVEHQQLCRLRLGAVKHARPCLHNRQLWKTFPNAVFWVHLQQIITILNRQRVLKSTGFGNETPLPLFLPPTTWSGGLYASLRLWHLYFPSQQDAWMYTGINKQTCVTIREDKTVAIEVVGIAWRVLHGISP